jgi:hypothetical protein
MRRDSKSSPWLGAHGRPNITQGRLRSPGDKLLEGARLFERACRLMLDGIRHQHPELDAQGAAALLADRLARLRALERR